MLPLFNHNISEVTLMKACLETVFALARMAPGFDDANNRAAVARAERFVTSHAAELEQLATGRMGHLSDSARGFQPTVDTTAAGLVYPAPGYIRSFLDLSTSHLDEEARTYLDQDGEGVVSYPTTYGWFIYVPTPESLRDYAVPQTLLNILDRARQLACEYVLLDCDALEDSELPTFDDDPTTSKDTGTPAPLEPAPTVEKERTDALVG
ncbi:hypothetical protein FHW79_005389 [Azospirillum sp. OGB3]|uniref:DUF5983 family protein n=1 Tax=Azospirillum sp. OGB3 TaxID=2587012 RepID=UPI00160590C6|nr:hypothetical protein [Azospirillum sp. OGB3]MBB3267724.1 hypothetical protein [Azospirillum sp. OGB3]